MSSSTSTEASTTTPDFLIPPNYEATISLEESFGGLSRRLWEERFKGKEKLFEDSEILYTGIGGAPHLNSLAPITEYGDKSLIPIIVDLEAKFGRIPKTLFLPASALFADHLISLRGLARTYKEMGVENIVAILTALPHERQDHMFTQDAQVMPQVTTLKDAVEILAGDDHIDGGLIGSPHSLRSSEFAWRKKFPLIPLDFFKFLVRHAELSRIPNIFIMGPDKGRKDEARMLASSLHAPMGSALKERNRKGDGEPTIVIPEHVLAYIKDHECNVVVIDDEIREARTTKKIAEALDGYAKSLTVCAVKGIFANVTGSSKTAIDNLQHELITRIVVTDAVAPLNKVDPINNKLEVLYLDKEIRNIVNFLQHNPVRPDDPQWLRNSEETGTLLRLDLSVEQV